jgi:fructokinase
LISDAVPPYVFVIGESLVDVVSTGATLVEHAGGSPMNVAYGLGRLGVSTMLRTSLGRDARGRRIAAHVASAGVVVLDGSASYAFDVAWVPGRVVVPQHAAIVHTGSISAVLEPGADDVYAAFVSVPADVLRSFDPNVRASVTPDADQVRARVEALVRMAHIVKLSDEDAAWLYPGEALDAVIDRLVSWGAGLAMITRGSEGCLAASPLARIGLPSRPVQVVDTIGAGDSFMSGALAAILQKDLSGSVLAGRLKAFELEEVADMALTCASVTVGRAGAQPPTAAELAAVGD